MYDEVFGLTEAPFQLTPDPQFLFPSPQHARAKAYMESTVVLSDGFVVLTGDIGCGKTTLLESFISELPDDVILAHVAQTQLSPVEFLQAMLVELGFEPFQMGKIELLTELKKFLVEKYAEGKKVLLVVDEAQNLSRKVLEEIRLLSGIEAQKEKVLRVILAGQPELSDKLDSRRLEQLTQRVRLRFHISALAKDETRRYMEHRLNVAGADDRQIFEEETFGRIFRYSGGIPRLVNILCDTAMLCASADENAVIDLETLDAAIEELQWVPYSERILERERALEATDQFEVASVPLAKLDVMYRGKLVGDLDLAAGRIIIGRTPENDLQINSKVVSKHHAQIITDLQQCVLEDLNSTNGVFVKARQVTRHRLNDGDVVRIGEHKLYFRDLRGSDPAPAENENPHLQDAEVAAETEQETEAEV